LYRWKVFTKIKTIYSPKSFWRGNPTWISILLDFIDIPFVIWLAILPHCHGRTIVTFVYVLEKIFDGCNAATSLNIYVAIKHAQNIRVVRHNPLIIPNKPLDLFFDAIIKSSIDRGTNLYPER
jgi:hypothetical protein